MRLRWLAVAVGVVMLAGAREPASRPAPASDGGAASPGYPLDVDVSGLW
jgi:hypothetical protein